MAFYFSPQVHMPEGTSLYYVYFKGEARILIGKEIVDLSPLKQGMGIHP